MLKRPGIVQFVLCQLIAWVLIASRVSAQTSDTVRMNVIHDSVVKLDSMQKTAFTSTNNSTFSVEPRRTIDMVLAGGAGQYATGTSTIFQPTANADFFARSSELDLSAGLHWGFSDPSTKAFTLGLRFPVSEQEDRSSGIYADADLLFIDNGADSDAFSTGFRAAIAAKWNFIEGRIAGEIRRFPFNGEKTQAWAGIELGISLNLLKEESFEMTPKDSLRAELRYIATTQELKDLDAVRSSDDLDEWLDRFWKARNVSGTLQNDARAEYMDRVQYVNATYGSPIQMGVNTDQGRVVLLYGKPDAIESVKSVIAGSDRRFTLWIYENRLKGYRHAVILFLHDDKVVYQNHGDYRQIYSNIPGEYSEGIPIDLPTSMYNYIQSF